MRCLVALLFALQVSLFAHAQSFELPATALADDAALAVSMPALAERVSVVYKENDRDKLLDSQFRLQIVAGHYADAANTIAALRELRLGNHQDADANRNFRYAIYARAKIAQREHKLAFDAALCRCAGCEVTMFARCHAKSRLEV